MSDLTDEEKHAINCHVQGQVDPMTLRYNARAWTVAMFDHALREANYRTEPFRRASIVNLLESMRSERLELEAQLRQEKFAAEHHERYLSKLHSMEQAESARHQEVTARLDRIDDSVKNGPKLHWTAWLNVALALVAAVASVIALFK